MGTKTQIVKKAGGYEVDGRFYELQPRQHFITLAFSAYQLGNTQASIDQYKLAAYLYRTEVLTAVRTGASVSLTDTEEEE